MGKFADPTKHALMCLEIEKITLVDIISKFILHMIPFAIFYLKDTVKETSFWKVVDQKIDWAGLLSVKSTLFIRAIV